MNRGKLSAEFASSEGVRQGDPLGSLLFSLSMRNTYSNAINNLDCNAVAVMDDIYIFGLPDPTLTAFDRFITSLPAGGLSVNLPKSIAFLPDNPSDLLISEFTDRNLLYSTESIPALGSIISRNPDIISNWLLDQVSTLHEPFFKAILDSRLPTQHAFALLRSCMVPRMNYWARTIAPSTFSAAAHAFDTLVVDSFCQRLNLPDLPDVARAQLELPVSVGGFGLTSLVLVSPAAWYCAFAQAFPTIRPLIESMDALSDEIPFVLTLSQCFTYFSKYSFPRGSPISADINRFWVDYQQKRVLSGAQRLIMAAIYKARKEIIFNGFDRDSSDRARLNSISAPFAGSWLTTLPIDPLFTIHNIHFALASRLRLGLVLFADVPCCICGVSILESPFHFMGCSKLSGARTTRHDRIVQVLSSVARLCGVVVQIEPRIDGQDKQRGDGELFFHSQNGIFDCYVMHPCAKTYVKPAQRPLGASAVGEKRKVIQYDTRCKAQGFLFYPFVLEDFGA